MHALGLTMLLLAGLACSSTDAWKPGPRAEVSFDEADATCRERARFVTGDGATFTDQQEYAACMESMGFVR